MQFQLKEEHRNLIKNKTDKSREKQNEIAHFSQNGFAFRFYACLFSILEPYTEHSTHLMSGYIFIYRLCNPHFTLNSDFDLNQSITPAGKRRCFGGLFQLSIRVFCISRQLKHNDNCGLVFSFSWFWLTYSNTYIHSSHSLSPPTGNKYLSILKSWWQLDLEQHSIHRIHDRNKTKITHTLIIYIISNLRTKMLNHEKLFCDHIILACICWHPVLLQLYLYANQNGIPFYAFTEFAILLCSIKVEITSNGNLCARMRFVLIHDYLVSLSVSICARLWVICMANIQLILFVNCFSENKFRFIAHYLWLEIILSQEKCK